MECIDCRPKGLYYQLRRDEIIRIHQQILKSQQDRDDKVRGLWAIVLDTLDFMRQAEPLKEIQGLEKTVQATMKQVYDCALFLRGYGEDGFTGEYLKMVAGSLLTTSLSQDGSKHFHSEDR